MGVGAATPLRPKESLGFGWWERCSHTIEKKKQVQLHPWRKFSSTWRRLGKLGFTEEKLLWSRHPEKKQIGNSCTKRQEEDIEHSGGKRKDESNTKTGRWRSVRFSSKLNPSFERSVWVIGRRFPTYGEEILQHVLWKVVWSMTACVLKSWSKQAPEVFGSLHICTASWIWLVESVTRLPLWEAYYPYTYSIRWAILLLYF